MTRQGLFEMANGGTLFLDELGELPIDLQPKLLRVLEQREIRRVGASKSIKVDVRVIAATNRNLEAEVARRPLPRRTCSTASRSCALLLPPLRERADDIPLLVEALPQDAGPQPPARRRHAASRASRATRSTSCAPTAGRATCASS